MISCGDVKKRHALHHSPTKEVLKNLILSRRKLTLNGSLRGANCGFPILRREVIYRCSLYDTWAMLIVLFPLLQLLLSQLALSPWTHVILSRPQNNQVIDSSLGTVPPPFNIIPTPKSVFYSLRSVEITELFISFKLLVPGGPSFGCVATLPCGRRNMWKRWTFPLTPYSPF